MLTNAGVCMRLGAAGKCGCGLGPVQGRSLAALGAVLHLLADREPQTALLPHFPLSLHALWHCSVSSGSAMHIGVGEDRGTAPVYGCQAVGAWGHELLFVCFSHLTKKSASNCYH